MRYNKLPGTDVDISVISLGTWVFGGDCWGDPDDSESIKVVKEAIDNGINFIDTAPIYGSGRSETVIGKALSGSNDKVNIATKCGLEQKGKSIRVNLSPEFLEKELNNSLKRLGVDKIDLYQCHWPDPNTPLQETFTQLKKFVNEGKIRYLGVSNFNKELLDQVVNIAEISTNQMPYSILNREIEEDLIPFCMDKKIGILSYGSLGGGILTGKYKEPPVLSKSDVKSFFYRFYKEPFWSKARAMVLALEEIAAHNNVLTSQVAINWVLSCPIVSSCIVGSRNVGQLKKNLLAAEWTINEDDILKIQKRYDEIF